MDENAILLTDDLAAKAATEADVEVHGSVGLISLDYSRGLVKRDEAKSLMHSLQSQTNSFVTDATIERGIELPDSRD